MVLSATEIADTSYLCHLHLQEHFGNVGDKSDRFLAEAEQYSDQVVLQLWSSVHLIIQRFAVLRCGIVDDPNLRCCLVLPDNWKMWQIPLIITGFLNFFFLDFANVAFCFLGLQHPAVIFFDDRAVFSQGTLETFEPPLCHLPVRLQIWLAVVAMPIQGIAT